ncbi:MAG: beta-propeller fold lactonase family protein, partial [Planctomycetes bacterium]|nr:beta-propeller fold lactonase family protein [Planctomycetota bacterium]
MRHLLKPCVVFTFLTIVLPLFAAGLPSAAFADAPSNQLTFYVGTYTRGASKGIYQCQLDLKTGAVKSLGLAAESENPSFLAIHPSGRFVYAVNEVGNFSGTTSGAVSAFRVDPKTGKLALLNQESSRGAAPCHLVVDKAGKNVLVANYGGGSVAVLPIQKGG